jgi:hypothetical protein
MARPLAHTTLTIKDSIRILKIAYFYCLELTAPPSILVNQADLPVLVLVTPAHGHDSQLGWFPAMLPPSFMAARFWPSTLIRLKSYIAHQKFIQIDENNGINTLKHITSSVPFGDKRTKMFTVIE